MHSKVGSEDFLYHFECSILIVITLKCFFLECWSILNQVLMEWHSILMIIFRLYHLQNRIFAFFLFQGNHVWNFHQNHCQDYILIFRGCVSFFFEWFFLFHLFQNFFAEFNEMIIFFRFSFIISNFWKNLCYLRFLQW